MSDEYNSRQADKFVVRLPDGMRERISQVAKDENRSMNAWFVNRLKKALENTEHTQSEGVPSVVFESHAPWTPIQGMYVVWQGETFVLTHLESVPGKGIQAGLGGVNDLVDLRALKPLLIKT